MPIQPNNIQSLADSKNDSDKGAYLNLILAAAAIIPFLGLVLKVVFSRLYQGPRQEKLIVEKPKKIKTQRTTNDFVEGMIHFREDTYVPEPEIIRGKINRGNKAERTESIREKIEENRQKREEARLVKKIKPPVSLHFKNKNENANQNPEAQEHQKQNNNRNRKH